MVMMALFRAHAQCTLYIVLEERESSVDLEANERQALEAPGWRI